MLEIDLKKLIKNYDQNLLDNLRGFGKDNDFLKFWVPGTDDYQSFLNLVDALIETQIFDVRIKILKNISEKSLVENIETFLLKISHFNKIIEDFKANLVFSAENLLRFFENCLKCLLSIKKLT